MKHALIAMLATVVCCQAHAGLVITKAGKVTFGEVTEAKAGVIVGIQIGDAVGKVTYKRTAVYWFTTDKRVTNHYLGALYAYKKKSFKVAKFLAQLSIKKEPKYKAKAQELMVLINTLNKIADPVEENKKKISGE